MKFGIAINDLRANAIIGILPTERTKAQKIAVDLEAVYEILRAESLESVDCHNSTRCVESRNDEGDDLCESPRNDGYSTHPLAPSAREGESIVDYALLREIILDSFKQNEFFYLESALVAIQRAILKRFPQILELDLSIKKLEIFSDCVPKVRLSWKKESHCHSEGAKQPKNPKIKSDIFLDSSPTAQNDRLVGNFTQCTESSNDFTHPLTPSAREGEFLDSMDNKND